MDLRDWVPADDLAHFVIAAVDRVDIAVFKVNAQGSGSEQYHPRMMLALVIYCYANGIFASRRIERATHRDVGPVQEPKPEIEPKLEWLKAMKAKLETAAARAKYKLRKQTVEPVFGIIKHVLGPASSCRVASPTCGSSGASSRSPTT